MMNLRTNLRQITPLLFTLFLVIVIALLFLNLRELPQVQTAPELASDQVSVDDAEAVDSEKASDISAMRWQAMARFYEERGLLTRDPFDYEQAADQLAFRWLAMARAYERAGLLNNQIDTGN